MSTLGVLLGGESLANHDQILNFKKAQFFNVRACEGFSYVAMAA